MKRILLIVAIISTYVLLSLNVLSASNATVISDKENLSPVLKASVFDTSVIQRIDPKPPPPFPPPTRPPDFKGD